jgi:formate-dependent nitrite reductase membrane component NrfD/ferredoxin
MFQRADGIVDFDTNRCIACKACLQACPYDAIYIDPEEHVAEKCNFCSHRVDRGLLPACVVVCPTESLVFGDLDDPTSRASRLLARHPTTVRRPEQGTRPKAFYIGAAEAVLDPLAAPHEDRYLWAERRPGGIADEVWPLTSWRAPSAHGASSGRALPVLPPPGAGPSVPGTAVSAPNAVRRPPPAEATDGARRGWSGAAAGSTAGAAGGITRAAAGMASGAASVSAVGPIREAAAAGAGRPIARVAYDVHHPRPWGLAVAAYLWTKGLGSGPFAVLIGAGWAGWSGAVFEQLVIAVVSLLGIAATALLLIVDLGRPDRFWRILRSPQRRSWLAIGAYILVAYPLVLGMWIVGTTVGLERSVLEPLGLLGLVGAVLAAVYTAFLLGQCEARDLWQSPLVGLGLLGQAALLGGVVLVGVDAAVGGPGALAEAGRTAMVGGGGATLFALLLGEVAASHPTPNARVAAHLLVRGPYRWSFWLGGVVGGGILPAGAALALGGQPGALALVGVVAALGLLWYEHGFIAAGQAVPIS